MLCEEAWKRRRRLALEESAASIVKGRRSRYPRLCFSCVALIGESPNFGLLWGVGMDWMGSDEMDYRRAGLEWPGVGGEERWGK